MAGARPPFHAQQTNTESSVSCFKKFSPFTQLVFGFTTSGTQHRSVIIMGRWKRNRRQQNKKKDKDGEASATAAATDTTVDRSSKKKRQPKEKQPDEPGRGRRDQLYNMIDRGCLRMETYYAVQGLHDSFWDEESDQPKPCLTDNDKERERQNWLKHMKSILPSSFRLGNDVDVELRKRLEHELDQLVGTEMEIFVETNEGGQQKRRTPTTASNTDDKSNTGGDQNVNQNQDQTFADNKSNIPQNVNQDEEKQKEEEHTAEPSNDDENPAVDAVNAPILVRKTVAPAKKIPYVPHAYQFSLDRNTIRRNPCLQQFHKWLKVQTAAGFVTRQETVSMIPPIVLNPESHHVVLDLCAAPGSKTSQLLEVVSLPTDETDLEPRGCVVANDADPKRAHMLVHQMRRINSPAVLVTNCDAQFFPMLRPGESVATINDSEPSQQYQEGMFDRVLCDVPCTGDGTARKNPHMWREWTQGAALSMHPLQLNIALQGARLTKVGGYLCYSTCSMNPIENEAVVAELLRQSKGALQLVEKRHDLPGLRARPGWSTWKVLREVQFRKEHRNRQNKDGKNNKTQEKPTEASQVNEAETKDTEGDNLGGDLSPLDVVEDVEVDETVEREETIDDVQNANGNEDRDDEKPAADDTGDSKSRNQRHQRIFLPFVPPASWDEATLSAMAASAGFVEFKSVEEVPESSKRKVRPTCFPPTAAEAATFGLEKCLRCLPQDMDTGGFFVALLHKVAPIRDRPRKFRGAAKTTTSTEEAVEVLEPNMKRAKIDGKDEGVMKASEGNGDETESKKSVEDPLQEDGNQWESQNKKGNLLPDKDGIPIEGVGRDDFISISDEIMEPLIQYYGLSADFPKDQLMARAGGEAHKVLYFISRSIKTLFDLGIQKRLTVINSGLKTFAKNNNHCDCGYRVAQEGIQFLVPYMTKRKVVADLEDFPRCLEGPHTLPIENFSAPFAEAVRPLDVGSFVVVLSGYERDFSRKLVVVMWRGRGDTLKSLVSRVETAGFKSKLRAIAGEPLNWDEIQQDATNDGEWHKLP
jgi:16S rRNA C967 or C1407 C5-methylase (RsmB/RsmF family)